MSKIFFAFLWTFANPTQAFVSTTIYCDLIASQFVSGNGQMKTIEEIQIPEDEGTIYRNLTNGETLFITRYFDWVGIQLKQKEDLVASASGSLQINKSAITVELGTRNYYVICRYK